MTPQVRFLFVLIFLASFAWLTMMITGYIWGPRGLNFERYIAGAILSLLSLGAGYATLVILLQFMNFRENRKTGFEATTVDETGTTFNMMLGLSKFVPEMVAPPQGKDISPLESELIGFLNSLGDWPIELNSDAPTLREHTLNIWATVKTLPGNTAYHRIGALSAYLGKVYEFSEQRRPAGFLAPRHKDKVSYKQRAHEHGGMAAFILSQMPSFRHLDDNPKKNLELRKALLTGVRYIHDAERMPTNCPPLAREIYEYFSRAQVLLSQKGQDTSITKDDQTALVQDLETHLPQVLLDVLQIENTPPYWLALNRTSLAITPDHLVQAILPTLSPALKAKFQLWENENAMRILMYYTLPQLAQKGIVQEQFEAIPLTHYQLAFTYNGTPLHPMLLFNLQHPLLEVLLEKVAPFVASHSSKAEPLLSSAHFTQVNAQYAADLKEELAGIFPRV